MRGKAIMLLVVWRLFMAVFVRTSFDPDEHWQGPEVAHRLVFGHGYLTWEWAAGLRSYLHPLLFTPLLFFLRALSSASPTAVQLAPRVTQAALAVVHDLVMAAFIRTHFPPRLFASGLAISTLSWFSNFTHARPFSNSLEATLHLACLTLWPTARPGTKLKAKPAAQYRWRRAAAIAAASVGVVVRPSAAPFYIFLALAELARSPAKAAIFGAGGPIKYAALFVADGLAAALPVQLTAAALDRAVYGRWVVPAWVNLQINAVQNVSADYGTHPGHWYVTQGAPAMLASLTPLVAVGAVTAGRSAGDVPLWPLGLAAVGIGILSAVPHKEFRYILPWFELLLPYAAIPLAWALETLGARSAATSGGGARATAPRRAVHSATNGEPADDSVAARVRQRQRHTRSARAMSPQASPTRQRRSASSHATATPPSMSPAARTTMRAPCGTAAKRKQQRTWRSAAGAALVVALVALQLPTLAYFARVHQRGTVAAAEWLAVPPLPPGSDVVFLTNCHATPWQSHIHNEDITMSFLDCSPPGWQPAVLQQNGGRGTGVFHIAHSEQDLSEQRTFDREPLHHLCRVFGGCGSGRKGGARRSMPTHFVMYDALADTVADFLRVHEYSEVARFGFNQFEGTSVVIFQW